MITVLSHTLCVMGGLYRLFDEDSGWEDSRLLAGFALSTCQTILGACAASLIIADAYLPDYQHRTAQIKYAFL